MKISSAFLLLISITLLGIASCKKSSSFQFVLTTHVSGGTVTLNWTKVNPSGLMYYMVYKISDSGSTTAPQTITVDKNTTQLIDTLPLAPSVQYYVVAVLTSSPGTLVSNKVKLTRSDLSLAYITPYDALYDQNHLIYTYSSTGNIAVYDLQTKKWIQQIAVQSNIGYCDIGTYNGKTELYVPRSDGWLFIYDAATLAQIDQINVGTNLYSVVCNNGILFISGTISSSFSSTIASYNRASKSKIAQTSTSENMRLRLVPGSNSEFFGISTYNDLFYVKFDNNGNYISSTGSYSGSNYSPTPGIFEVFPDGSNMITSSSGVIFSKSLVYVSTLPHGTTAFNTFCFDNTGQLIYGGSDHKTIMGYSMSNYQLSKTINTVGYPYKIFYSNGTVISVSTNNKFNYYYGATGTYTGVEQF